MLSKIILAGIALTTTQAVTLKQVTTAQANDDTVSAAIGRKIKAKIGEHLANNDVSETFKAVAGDDEKISFVEFMGVVKKIMEEVAPNVDFDAHKEEIGKRAKKALDEADLNDDGFVGKCEFGAMMVKGVVESEGNWQPKCDATCQEYFSECKPNENQGSAAADMIERKLQEKIGEHLANNDVSKTFQAVAGDDEMISFNEFMHVVRKLLKEVAPNLDFDAHKDEIRKRARKALKKADLNDDGFVGKCEFGAMMFHGVVASEGTWQPKCEADCQQYFAECRPDHEYNHHEHNHHDHDGDAQGVHVDGFDITVHPL